MGNNLVFYIMNSAIELLASTRCINILNNEEAKEKNVF